MGNRLHYSVIGTLAVLFIGNAYSAYEIYTLAQLIVPSLDLLSQPLMWSFGLNVASLVTCGVAFASIAFLERRRSAAIVAIAALSILLLVAFASLPTILHLIQVADLTVFGGALPWLFGVAWLTLLLWAVISNYALERTDGRGLDVS